MSEWGRTEKPTSRAAEPARGVCPLTSEEALCNEFDEVERRRATRPSEVASGDPPFETFSGRLSRLHLTALCLSGGGIRSAAFCLGVLQSLAAKKLLNNFDYLSTVSGGGFIGGWLQMVLRQTGNVASMQNELGVPGREPVQALRAYTNYLAPHTGPFSQDVWAGAVLYVRNLILNWLIFIPFFLLIALGTIFYRTALFVTYKHATQSFLVVSSILTVSAIALIIATWQACSLLPSHRIGTSHGFAETRDIQNWIVVPALTWAILVPFAFDYSLWRQRWSTDMQFVIPALYFGCMVLGYVVAGIIAARGDQEGRALFRVNWLRWLIASACAGFLLWLGFRLACPGSGAACPDPHPIVATSRSQVSTVDGTWYFWAECMFLGPNSRLFVNAETFTTVLVPPWLVVIHGLQTTFYIGLRKEGVLADLDREWLARLNGLLLRAAAGWLVVTFCCLMLGQWLNMLPGHWPIGIGTLGTALLGPAVALIGQRTRAGIEAIPTPPAKWISRLLSFAALLFGAVILACAGNLVTTKVGAIGNLMREHGAPLWMLLILHIIIGIVLACLFQGFSRVNVNRFSMHAVYRNRLTRAFLGAPRRNGRTPEPFTGFDPDDNPRLSSFCPGVPGQRLFPVINATLNITAPSNTAWAERQAASFTATPLACGSAGLRHPRQPAASGPAGAFVPTRAYAGQDSVRDHRGAKSGVRIGTMLTISGAALSPNLGYNSSRPTAFLMTLFNVRLGAWLPNPAVALPSELSLAQPRNSTVAILRELLGTTTDRSQSVYLSDGGHFDNLALYEMLRRHCREIIVIDAGEDEKCTMFDLGNAIRKAEIDLNVQVVMDPMNILARDAMKNSGASPAAGFAIGTILYPEDPPDAPSGRLVYVKPSFLPDIPAEVRAYGATKPRFPHQSTRNQFFTESEFESYRALGRWQMDRVIKSMAASSKTSDRPWTVFTPPTPAELPPNPSRSS